MEHPKQKKFPGENVPVGGAARSLLDDESGGTLVFSALALTVVLGMAGLGIDAAMWLTSKRQMQNVADAGVVSAVTVLAKSGGTAEVKFVY